jgi:hypothetical protein
MLASARMRSNSTTPRVNRVAGFVAWAACLSFAFGAAWGICKIPGGGHIDSGSVATTTLSEGIARFHLVYPAKYGFTGTMASPPNYYCHHPFGSFYASAICLWLFGDHDFVVHLPAVLMSFAIPPMLYGIGKRIGGAVIGAVAACAYAVVPIALGFASYNNLETPAIFGSLLFFWGHSYHQTTRKAGYGLASLIGLLLACSADWCGYALVAPLIGWCLLRAFVFPPRWTPAFDFRTYARWWAFSATIAVTTFVVWLGLFYRADRIADWLASGNLRGSDGTPLKAALAARANWIDFSFTPLAIWLGKVAVPVVFARVLIFRQDEEIYSLSILFGAVAQYVAFKRGADVHVFWPHYFAEYYALAMAQLASSAGALARLLSRWFAPSRSRTTIGAWIALIAGILPSIAMAPDAVRSLPIWHRTGGRYDGRGNLIRNDMDLLFILKKVLGAVKTPNSVLHVNPSIVMYYEQAWAWHGAFKDAGDPEVKLPASTNDSYWIARASGFGSSEQIRIANLAHVQAYGDIWVVDQRQSPGPIDAWRVEERDPHPIEWVLWGGWEPVRAVRGIDPLKTWEWRVHLGQRGSLPSPSDAPEPTLDDLRILHNAAVYAGATARVQELRLQIEAQLDRSVATDFEGGVRLVGVRVTRGAEPRLESWFVAPGPLGSDATFRIRSSVAARARFSLIPVNTTDRELAYPPSLPTKLWRPGFLYEFQTVLNHRIGVERYWGTWSHPGLRRLDHQAVTTLATVR